MLLALFKHAVLEYQHKTLLCYIAYSTSLAEVTVFFRDSRVQTTAQSSCESMPGWFRHLGFARTAPRPVQTKARRY